MPRGLYIYPKGISLPAQKFRYAVLCPVMSIEMARKEGWLQLVWDPVNVDK